MISFYRLLTDLPTGGDCVCRRQSDTALDHSLLPCRAYQRTFNAPFPFYGKCIMLLYGKHTVF